MSSNKHERQPGQGEDVKLSDDLEQDPEIGKSKGAFATGEDPAEIAGENTVEGDVENDSSLGGSADPNKLGRTNR